MPTTYPIFPGDRLQRRIATVLETDLFGLDAFTGFTVHNEREFEEVQLPFIGVHITEAQEMPPRSGVWHIKVTVGMVEDRQDANMELAGDDRPRHELRAENMSARIFGIWNGLSLGDAINAISNGQGVRVLKTHSGVTTNAAASTDEVETEYSFTVICVSTEQ